MLPSVATPPFIVKRKLFGLKAVTPLDDAESGSLKDKATALLS